MSNANYRYTVDCGLTPEQRDFYEENGYIIFRKLLPDEDLDICKQRFLDVCNGKVSVVSVIKDIKVKATGETRPEYLFNKIQEIVYDDVFYKHYASHPNLVEAVKKFIGPNVTATHSMVINKPPVTSELYATHHLHQDLHYFPFRPADKIVAAWTAMEEVTVENGCLYVLPGSHKGPLLQHKNIDPAKKMLFYGLKGYDDIPKVNLIMEKGDTVFFHPHLMHGSGLNTTKGFRKSISIHFADSNCHFINHKGTVHEAIGGDSEELFAKMYNEKVNFQFLWRMKSRLICGKPGNFQKFGESHL
ncbi:PREDICTED: phytanoyl-CoA dioxygenase, peroxisomal-like [Nicrophorus vespilloides]|uniref:phytanoyl-CoA dioxygenase n=1 Tax=Nicrophorus vespilloides TaxID=110193 RepID=A0ABM1MT28_NICVS|nr:PREDICTED: phytanoyl-CoA dioxygenase, peroxisomal-like [Nicrophorus vespilloides]